MITEITLFTHITDGGAVYLTNNHDFAKASTVIRLDGGAELVRCVTENEVLDTLEVFRKK